MTAPETNSPEVPPPRILNEFFGVMIELVHAHGGDVVQFSGDALTVLWRVRSETTSDAADADAPASEEEAVRLAAACASSMQVAIGTDARLRGGPLTMHMGLGCGGMTVAHRVEHPPGGASFAVERLSHREAALERSVAAAGRVRSNEPVTPDGP